MPTSDSKIILSWSAPEFVRHDKGPAWFIILGIVVGIFFIISLLMKNYFFAVLILMAGGLIYIHALKHPRTLKFSLSEEQLKVGDHIFHLSDLKSFWIFEDPDVRLLRLETKRTFMPQLHLPLGDQQPQTLRQAFIQFIPEKKQQESLIDIFSRKIKF